MSLKSDAILKEAAAPRHGGWSLQETAKLYVGYLLLAVMCLGFSILAIALRLFLPRAMSKRLGRKLIVGAFRFYLRSLVLMGACRFDLSELDALRGGPPMIVAPNHPSSLDAIMILSRLPDAGCIMKANIVNNILFGAGARLGCYIRSTPIRTMVQLAIADLRDDSHVLLFPEGTRTTRFPVSSLQGTTGLISKHAGMPVQTLFIETSSGFLGKGWSIFRTPEMPITYRIRLGKRFAPPANTAEFTQELEQYFLAELAHAQLPQFTAPGPPARSR
jgi:1-acyl-sn-glycerol-3-phosphate acyltransferase